MGRSKRWAATGGSHDHRTRVQALSATRTYRCTRQGCRWSGKPTEMHGHEELGNVYDKPSHSLYGCCPEKGCGEILVQLRDKRQFKRLFPRAAARRSKEFEALRRSFPNIKFTFA